MPDDEDFKELFTRLITIYELAPDVADELLQSILLILCDAMDEAEDEESRC